MWLGGSVTAVALVGRTSASSVTSASVGAYGFGTCRSSAAATLGAVVPLRLGKWVPTPGRSASLLLAIFTVFRRALRRAPRRPRPGRRRPSPSNRRVHRGRPRPDLLLRRHRAALHGRARRWSTHAVTSRAAIARAGVGQLADVRRAGARRPCLLPPAQVTSLHGLIDAMRTVFTVYGGSVAADGTATLQRRGRPPRRRLRRDALHLGAARERLGVDHGCGTRAGRRVPRRRRAPVLGRISERSGVPVVMGLVSGGVSLAHNGRSTCASSNGDGSAPTSRRP